jgi:tight adherence protein C
LPDILDLLSVSVEAGLGFDAALQKVVEKTKGPLTMEFEKTLQEINIGKSRREALRDMQARVNADDVTTFLGSIIQADQLGVSITNVLRIQSKQVRENRKMRAEEKAQKAPVKILIPLVLFIFPTIFIVLLGPAAIQLIDTL